MNASTKAQSLDSLAALIYLHTAGSAASIAYESLPVEAKNGYRDLVREIQKASTRDPFDDSNWFEPGGPAYQVWHCGRCDNEVSDCGSDLACETCGSVYDARGAYLGDGEEDAR